MIAFFPLLLFRGLNIFLSENTFWEERDIWVCCWSCFPPTSVDDRSLLRVRWRHPSLSILLSGDFFHAVASELSVMIQAVFLKRCSSSSVGSGWFSSATVAADVLLWCITTDQLHLWVHFCMQRRPLTITLLLLSVHNFIILFCVIPFSTFIQFNSEILY